VLGGFVVGLVNNDNIAVAYTTTAGVSSVVGDYAITPVTNDPDKRLSNYTLKVFNGVLHVEPAPLAVTADSMSRLYGAQNPPLTGSVVGVVNGDNITAIYSTTAVIGSVVGNYPIAPSITDPGNRLANYTVTLKNGVLAVQPAPLVVTADSKSRFYASPNPILTGSLAGRMNGDNLTASYTTAATISSMPGNYPIVPSIVDPDHRISNYVVTLSNGVLTVIPAPIITLSADSISSSLMSSPDMTSADTAATPTTSLRFGNQNLLSRSSLRLTVGNIGTAPLLIDSVVLGGVNVSDFTKTNNCGATLAVNANCTIDVTFTPLALRSRAASLILTDNNGGYMGSQQVVSLSGNSVLRYSAYATSTGCGAITLSGNASIDSFDSSSSGLPVTASAASGDIAVNGNVTLKGSAAVRGTIYAPNTTAGVCKNGAPIPGITLSGKGQATSGYSKLTPVAFTTVLPRVTIGAADVKVNDDDERNSDDHGHSDQKSDRDDQNSGGNKVFPPLTPGSYRDIVVSGHSTLTLLPGTYAIRSLKLTGGAKITLAPSKTASSDAVIINILETNVDNPLDLRGGSVTNAPGDPAKLFFFYGGTGDISLTGAADSYGIVYAPNAAVKLSGQADWYGALVVKTLESTGGSALHYDRNLGR